MNPIKKLISSRLAAVALAFSAGLALSDLSAAENSDKLTSAKRAPVIFLCGDSTMSNKPLFPAQPERGWGQLLPLYFKEPVRIENLAMNGRSTKSFRDEGRWQPVLDRLQPGDYVIVQFGHNDQKQDDPKRYTNAMGSFKENLARYVREVREKQGHPVLATPVTRRSFNSQGELRDTHGDYSVAARQVAAEQKVPLLELHLRSAELVAKLGPERSKKMFMWYEPGEFASLPEGKQDSTHFNAYGASRICDLAAEEIKINVPGLAGWLKLGK
jgi:lysophospholipase L1-like esterase